MIDSGFYVTAVYDSTLTFYHDSGVTQLADDPSFGNVNVGVGDSAAPVMFAVAGSTDSGDSSNNYPISEWSVADEASLQDMLIVDAVAAGTDPYHVDEATITSIALAESQQQAIMPMWIDPLVVQLYMRLMARQKI